MRGRDVHLLPPDVGRWAGDGAWGVGLGGFAKTEKGQNAMSEPLIGHSALPTATDDLLGIMAERDQAVKERDEALDALKNLYEQGDIDHAEHVLRKHGRL